MRGRIGAALIGAVVAMALLSLLWTPYDVSAIDVGGRLAAPSAAHWFGTDHLGRDVLSMIMGGAHVSLLVALLAVAGGMAVGVPAGLLAAALGGLADEIVMRLADVAFALPALMLALLLAAVMGPGATSVALAVGLFNIPVFARLTRNVALGIRSRDFIAAARVAGRSWPRIALFHILPNALGPILVQATIQLSLALIAEAGLSYVGLGVQPPAPSWGRMLAEAQTLVADAPWLVIAPGLALTLTVLGLNLTGDALGRRIAR